MKDEQHKLKNRVIFTMLVAIAVMITAIVVLARNNDHRLEPVDGDGRWQIEFTSIAEGEKVGNASSKHSPRYTSTYATFYAEFVAPGDSITYNVQVSNLGTLDAKLSSILYITSPNKEAIKYEIINLKENDIVKAGEVRNFKVKVSYELHSNVAVEFNKPIQMQFNFKQA